MRSLPRSIIPYLNGTSLHNRHHDPSGGSFVKDACRPSEGLAQDNRI
jgi:hypothetical protein